jgi:uncharacterized cupin superfamily protein
MHQNKDEIFFVLEGDYEFLPNGNGNVFQLVR